MIRPPIILLPPLEPHTVQFQLNRTQPRGGSDLRELLYWELIYEDLHAVRLRLVHLLATVGVAVWLTGRWPALVSSTLREALFWVTGIMLFATVAAAVGEWICYTCRERQLVQFGPRVVAVPPEP
jgi:hypothetical protein